MDVRSHCGRDVLRHISGRRLLYNEVIIVHPKCMSSGKHVRVMYTPQTPLLYSKTGVCGGIPIFLIFAPKHRLWVLVRTA